MKNTHSITLLLLIFSFTNIAFAADDTEKRLARIAAGEHRSEAHIARNQYRNPVETLHWFGLRDDMTVVEISPGGGGWYTEILAPFLRDNGKLYAASYDSKSEREYFRKNAKKYLDKLAAQPEVYDKVVVTEFEPPKKTNLQPQGQADMVLTFRNTHNWIRAKVAEATFAAMYEVLKPGAILGLVQHRGSPEMTGKGWAKKGYVSEAEVIRLAESAGFTLLGRAEINANPKDTRDHPAGVWTLPPVYRLKDQGRDKYAAIGESDRMTLKFIKPE